LFPYPRNPRHPRFILKTADAMAAKDHKEHKENRIQENGCELDTHLPGDINPQPALSQDPHFAFFAFFGG
jgi:hypothetical protein